MSWQSANSQDALDRLDSWIRGQPTFWEVRCMHCQFTAVAWLRDEAGMRGRIHEHAHGTGDGNHPCEVQKVLARDDIPGELGTVEYNG